MSARGLTALAPDTTFPRRDELLDDVALAERLSSLLDRDVERCERVRTTYHPGRSLRALFEVAANGGTLLVSARMFAPGTSSTRFERANAEHGCAMHDAGLSTVFCVYPNDRKLVGLPHLAAASSRLVAYSPEQSATFALERGSRVVAYSKLYADDGWERAARVHRALGACGAAVPTVVAAWPALRTLTVTAVDGERPAGVDGYRAFGAALASLHRAAPLDERVFTRSTPGALVAAARTIAAVRPDAAELAAQLAHALRATAPTTDSSVCVHGDVHPKNVLVADGVGRLVDLDDVAAGDPAADVGGALAGLRYDEIVGRDRSGLATALLEGYASEATLPARARLAWQTAGALLGERALRSVTRLRTEGLSRLPEVLRAGMEVLG